VAIAKNLGLAESARAFALIDLVAADAAIAVWDAKYALADPNGQSPSPTPPYPEYPSGQVSLASAYATTLAALFGDDPGVPGAADFDESDRQDGR
jgi:hypothetical protein